MKRQIALMLILSLLAFSWKGAQVPSFAESASKEVAEQLMESIQEGVVYSQSLIRKTSVNHSNQARRGFSKAFPSSIQKRPNTFYSERLFVRYRSLLI